MATRSAKQATLAIWTADGWEKRMCELVLRTKADGTDIPVFSWKKSNGRGRELGSLQVHMIGKQRIQDAASLPYFTLYSGVGEAQSFCAGSNAEMQEWELALHKVLSDALQHMSLCWGPVQQPCDRLCSTCCTSLTGDIANSDRKAGALDDPVTRSSSASGRIPSSAGRRKKDRRRTVREPGGADSDGQAEGWEHVTWDDAREDGPIGSRSASRPATNLPDPSPPPRKPQRLQSNASTTLSGSKSPTCALQPHEVVLKQGWLQKLKETGANAGPPVWKRRCCELIHDRLADEYALVYRQSQGKREMWRVSLAGAVMEPASCAQLDQDQRIPLTLFERGGEAFTFARVEGEQSAGLQQWWQILKQVLDGHEVTAAAASPLEPGGAEGFSSVGDSSFATAAGTDASFATAPSFTPVAAAESPSAAEAVADAKLKEVTFMLHQLTDEFQVQTERAQQDRAKFTDALAAQTGRLAAQTSQIASQTAQREEMERVCTALQANVYNQNARVEQEVRANAALSSQLSAAGEENKQIEMLLLTLQEQSRRQLEQTTDEMTTAHSEQLRAVVAEAQARLSTDLAAEAEEHEERYRGLFAEFEELRRCSRNHPHPALPSHHAAVESENRRLEQDVAGSRADSAQLQQALRFQVELHEHKDRQLEDSAEKLRVQAQAGREMAGKIEEMHGRIGDLRIENASYLQTLEEADVEITQLQAELRSKSGEADRAVAENGQVGAANQTLSKELSTLQGDVIARLGLELAARVELEGNLAACQQATQEQDAIMSEMRTRLSAAEQAQSVAEEQLTAQLAELKAEHGRVVRVQQAEHAEESRELVAELSTSKAAAARRVSLDAAAASAERQTLELEVTLAKQGMQSAVDQLSAVGEQARALRLESQQLQHTIEQLRLELARAQQEVGALHTLVDQLSTQNEDRASLLTKQRESTSAQASVLRSQSSSQAEQIAGLSVKATELDEQLADSLAANHSLTAQLKGLAAQNAALERTISALRAENNGKDLVVNTLRSELGMSNTAATAAADTNTAQDRTISSLRADITSLDSTVHSLRAAARAAKAATAAAAEQNAELDRSITALRGDNSALDSTVNSLRSEVSAASAAAATASADFGVLAAKLSPRSEADLSMGLGWGSPASGESFSLLDSTTNTTLNESTVPPSPGMNDSAAPSPIPPALSPVGAGASGRVHWSKRGGQGRTPKPMFKHLHDLNKVADLS